MHFTHIRTVSISRRSRLPALRTYSSWFAATLAVVALAACSRGPGDPALADKSAPQPGAHAAFDLRGEIVGIIAERRVLLVHHEEIPNYMPAMTMEFKVGAADISAFKEGQKLAAKMIDEKNGEFRLEDIRILDATRESIVAAAARDLKEDTHVRGKGAYRELGETVPRFSLYNQDGEVVSIDRLRGRRIVLNFIFTRCPVATMCPAATERMAKLQRLAKEKNVAGVHFVSISLDPAYDTPAVLKAYAAAYGIDPANFSFLTGPESAVVDLLTQFGVLREKSETVWKHTLATLLIDRDGRIVHRVDGSTWEPEDFLARL